MFNTRIGNHCFHFSYCKMDKFIVKRKREVDEKSENDDSVESQILKSATVSVPTCDVKCQQC